MDALGDPPAIIVTYACDDAYACDEAYACDDAEFA